MQNFIRLHVIESKIALPEKNREKGIIASPSELYVPNLHHKYF